MFTKKQILAIPAGQEIVPNRYRPLVIGFSVLFIIVLSITVQLGTGATVKYEVGGLLSGWRWSYYLPAIICGVNFFLNFLFYRPPPTRLQREKIDRNVLVKSLDYFGNFLGVIGLVLFTIALIWGGNTYAWDSVQVLTTLLIGFAILVAFGIYEWKGTNRGILAHALFENRNFPILLAVAFVDGILLFGLLAFLPQEVAAV